MSVKNADNKQNINFKQQPKLTKDDHNSKSRKELSRSKLTKQVPKGKPNVRDLRSISKGKPRIQEHSSSLEHSSSNDSGRKRPAKKAKKQVPQ
jgi:hypothetical protein